MDHAFSNDERWTVRPIFILRENGKRGGRPKVRVAA
jgi:hypothetical protein